MTHEEIRARLYAAHGHISLLEAKEILNRELYFSAKRRADRLLTAHLEITKPLREAADELEKALDAILNNKGLKRITHGFDALARYRAVKGEG